MKSIQAKQISIHYWEFSTSSKSNSAKWNWNFYTKAQKNDNNVYVNKTWLNVMSFFLPFSVSPPPQSNDCSEFSSIPWLTGLLGQHEGWFRRDPLPVFSAGGPCEQFWHGQGCPLFHVVHPTFPLPTMMLWAVLAWAGISTLSCCPSSISSDNHDIAHPLRSPEGWFWRGCHGVWHAHTMQVSISWQLPEEAAVDPKGSWSCSAPSHWSCAPSVKYGEVSSRLSVWCLNHYCQRIISPLSPSPSLLLSSLSLIIARTCIINDLLHSCEDITDGRSSLAIMLI